jgi:hypothetical protein
MRIKMTVEIETPKEGEITNPWHYAEKVAKTLAAKGLRATVYGAELANTSKAPPLAIQNLPIYNASVIK